MLSFLIQLSALAHVVSATASERHSAKFTLAELGIGVFFGAAAMLPVFVGALIAGSSCLRMRAKTEKERLGLLFRPRDNRGGAEVLVGLVYVVALGCGFSDLLGLMMAGDRGAGGVQRVYCAALGTYGSG